MKRLQFGNTHSVITITVSLLLTVASVPLLHAQDLTRDTTVNTAATPLIDVAVPSGNVIIRGIQGTAVRVSGLNSNQHVRVVGATLSVADLDNSRSVDLKDERQQKRERKTLRLEVPRNARVIVNTRSADVDAENLAGGVDITSVSGDLRLANIHGAVTASTMSGDISTAGLTRSLNATTTSGKIRVGGGSGRLEIHTVSGDVRIDARSIGMLSAETVNGDVAIDGNFAEDARVSINTQSGSVALSIPNATDGTLSFSSVSGRLESELPLAGSSEGAGSGERRQLVLGRNGRARFDITTFSGNVRVHQKN